jgi:hypothetical protein
MMVNENVALTRTLVNVVIEGPGTVWVDEVKVAQAKGLSAMYVPES